MFLNLYDNMTDTAKIIITIALMLFLGFLATRVTKKLKLPNVTAYIVIGIIIGPFCLNIVTTDVVNGMDFLSDIALAFIAFNMGEFFRIKVFKELGLKVILISLINVLVVFILVFILTYFIFNLELGLSIILASISGATGPATTVMTIRQKKAKGNFVNTLLLVIAFDDILSLFVFSIASSLVGIETSINFMDVLLPLLINIGILLLGLVFGFILKLLMPETRTTDNRLIIVIAVLFLFCGICALLNVSPLLGCMAIGLMYINITNDEKLFSQLSYFAPPIYLLFFVKSGIDLNINSLFSTNSVGTLPLFVIALFIFLIRDIGKYTGSLLGSMASKQDKDIKKYLGLALMPQGGVTLGLAALGMRSLSTDSASALTSITICVVILNEIFGPLLANLSLLLAKTYSNNIDEVSNVSIIDENGKRKSDVQILIDRINDIQKNMPAHEENYDEQAFTEASLEQYYAHNEINKKRNWNRRK